MALRPELAAVKIRLGWCEVRQSLPAWFRPVWLGRLLYFAAVPRRSHWMLTPDDHHRVGTPRPGNVYGGVWGGGAAVVPITAQLGDYFANVRIVEADQQHACHTCTVAA